MPLSRTALLGCALVLLAAPAEAQFSGVTGGLTVNTPIGDFGENATVGWGLVARTGLGDVEKTWSGRATLGFDYFKGKGPYSTVQFVNFGADIVHKSRPSFYQFAGFFQSQSKFVGHASSSGFAAVRQTSDFGLTGGIGINLEREKTKLFVEFAATTVFTGASNSSWFPIRAGLRF
jgi:hypothetical protein